MVMMEIDVGGEIFFESAPLVDSISGVIGLAGTHKGILGIHLPNAVAMAITSSFLDMAVEEINEDVEDAVGELANMLGGDVKSFLSDKGRAIELSMPTTVFGQEYDFQPTQDVDKFLIPFKCDAGTFAIELQLEK